MVISKKQKPKVILGLDLSTNAFAFAKFDNGTLVSYGKVAFKGKSTFDRLGDAQRKLWAMRDLFKDVELIRFEGATYIQNKRTVIFIAYAIGAQVSAIVPPGCEVDDVPPVTWQKWIGNPSFTKNEKEVIYTSYPDKTKAQYDALIRSQRKQRTIDIINKKFNIAVSDDDVADAIGVGWYASETL